MQKSLPASTGAASTGNNLQKTALREVLACERQPTFASATAPFAAPPLRQSRLLRIFKDLRASRITYWGLGFRGSGFRVQGSLPGSSELRDLIFKDQWT